MLRIDKDDLDTALSEQPDIYFEVCEQHDMAVARRDACKLDLSEAEAVADLRIRRDYAEQEEKDEKGKKITKGPKVTEALIANEVALDQEVRDIKRRLIGEKTEADLWGSLKDAYHERSKMLPELVSKTVAQMYQHGLADRPQRDLSAAASEINRAEAGRMRQERRRATQD